MTAIQKSLSIAFKKQIHINSINQWLKNSSKLLEEELERVDKLNNNKNNSKMKPKNIKVLEMDELFTYIKKNPEILKESHILIKENKDRMLENKSLLLFDNLCP